MNAVRLLGVVLALALVAPASSSAESCRTTGTNISALACSHSFVAREKPRRFAAAVGNRWGSIITRWTTFSGREFIAWGNTAPWCVDNGRYGDLRVSERYCEKDAPFVVTVRSVGPPTPVYFEWEWYRRGG
jgi:hypothetical protein